MKKVLIATGIFPPQVGGPATYSKLLFDELPTHGFEVKIENFGDILFLPKIVRHIVYFFKLIIKSLRVDIIYAQDPVSVGLPALFAAKILGKKFYLKIVGDYAWEQGVQRYGVADHLDLFSVEYKKYSLQVRFLKRIEFFVANHADKIIVPSNYLKKIVINWGVSASKIFVIYNAFDAPEILGTKIEIKNKLGISGKMMVSAGRLVPWKGYDVLIDVMPQIIKQIPNIKLFIIGDGPDRSSLKEKITKLGFENLVFLTGKMEQRNLFEYIKASDLFVLNTSYEGFSHQILEVLALETPIITTRVGGNVEIIHEGKNGILVEYNDKEKIVSAVVSILSNPETLSLLVKNGRDELSNFTQDKMLIRLSEVLKQ